MSGEEFYNFCVANPDLRLELEKNGSISYLPLKGLTTSAQSCEVVAELYLWIKKFRNGRCFSPSAGFTLPDTSVRMADASWLSGESWSSLSESERNCFGKVVPDFVVEVRSQSDSLEKLKNKMTETWIANGVRLAWLIDPIEQKTYIYRKRGTEEVLTGFNLKLSGEDVLPGFEFELSLLLED